MHLNWAWEKAETTPVKVLSILWPPKQKVILGESPQHSQQVPKSPEPVSGLTPSTVTVRSPESPWLRSPSSITESTMANQGQPVGRPLATGFYCSLTSLLFLSGWMAAHRWSCSSCGAEAHRVWSCQSKLCPPPPALPILGVCFSLFLREILCFTAFSLF